MLPYSKNWYHFRHTINLRNYIKQRDSFLKYLTMSMFTDETSLTVASYPVSVRWIDETETPCVWDLWAARWEASVGKGFRASLLVHQNKGWPWKKRNIWGETWYSIKSIFVVWIHLSFVGIYGVPMWFLCVYVFTLKSNKSPVCNMLTWLGSKRLVRQVPLQSPWVNNIMISPDKEKLVSKRMILL